MAEDQDPLDAVLHQLAGILEETSIAKSEEDAESLLNEARVVAMKVESDILQAWSELEEAQPAQPHRALGLHPNVGANKDAVKEGFLQRMSSYLAEDKNPKGASRIMLLKSKRAFELLTDQKRWEAYQADREAKIEEGTLGKLRYANGFYEGGIVMDSDSGESIREGKGAEVLGSGEIYEGQYSKDQRKGLAVCFWSNGDLYLGHWSNDTMAGKGMYYYSNGSRFVGNFKEGMPSGQGHLTWSDGTQFGGNFENGIRTGQGALELPKSTSGKSVGSYEGQWKENYMSGKGCYKITDSKGGVSVYEGEFKENMFHGRGKLQLPGGAMYDGSFLRGQPDGDACQYYQPGEDEIYQGDFRGAKRNGFGEASSSVFNYAGTWKDDKPDGEGKMILKSVGKPMVMNGSWLAGELDGHADVSWPSGAKYSGKFSKGAMNGAGVVTFQDGSTWEGKFIENNAEAAMQR